MKLLPQIDPLNNSENIDDVKKEEDDDYYEQDEDDSVDDATSVGDVIRVSDDCGEKRNHFRSFEFDGNVFNLEDTVLVAPGEGKVKPSVEIIKAEGGSLMVCGRRFYRPEEAEKTDSGTWESWDARELFYRSSLDELNTCNVMHKCVIHLIPLGKELPDRRQQPGFIVQKFYDFATKKVRNLTEKDCEGIMFPPGAAATA